MRRGQPPNSDIAEPAEPAEPDTDRAALLDALQRRELMASVARDGTAIHDGRRMIEVDDALCRIFGYTREEALRSHPVDWIAPEARAAVARRIAVGTSGAYESVGLRRDGSTFPVEFTGHTVPYRGRRVRVVMVRDLTERKAAEAAARVSETRLRLALKAARLGLGSLDLRCGTLDLNGRALRFFGLPPNRPVTLRDLHDRYHPDDRDRLVLGSATPIPASRRFIDDEFRVVRPDGSTRWIALRSEILRDADGTPDRAVGILMDVTDHKRTEAALRAAIEQKELAARELSHRVKNTLQMVASLLTLQATRISDPAAARELEQAHRRVNAIAQAHAALYSNRPQGDVAEATVDFAELLQTLAEGLGGLADDDTVTVRIRGEPLALPADQAVPLGLIATELLTNALKHALPPPSRGEVRADFRAGPGGGCRLVVADTGPGLPAGAEAATSGLGIQLVRALVAQIGGEMTMANEPGLRVTIAVPPPRTA